VKPVVLRTPHVPGAAWQKVAWIKTYLGEHVQVITCRSADKCLYAQPGDILIEWKTLRRTTAGTSL